MLSENESLGLSQKSKPRCQLNCLLTLFVNSIRCGRSATNLYYSSEKKTGRENLTFINECLNSYVPEPEENDESERELDRRELGLQ